MTSTENAGDYLAAIAKYQRVCDRASAELEAAQRAYREETDQLDEADEEAMGAAKSADRAAHEARELVTEVDRASMVMWRRLADLVGSRRAGSLEAPRRVRIGDADTGEVRTRVRQSERLLSLAQAGELPLDPPRYTNALAVVFGAVSAVVAVLVAVTILGGEASTGEQGIATVVMFAGVAAGPAALQTWLAWQHRVKGRGSQIVISVATSGVVLCGLSFMFLRGI